MNIAEENGAVSVPVTTGAPVLPPTLGYSQIPTAKKPEIPIPFTGADSVFALLFLVCGYLFVWLITPEGLGMGVTLFTAVFCTLVLLYTKSRGRKVPRNSWFWLALVLLDSVSFSLFTNVSLQFLNLLFLMGCAVYWVAVLTSGRMEGTLGTYFLPDMVNQLLRVPFLNFGCASKIIRRSSVKNRKSRVLLSSLCGAVAALPILGIVLSLLMQADGAFQNLVKQFSADVDTHVVNFLFRLLPAFLTGSYLFGLLYGNIEKRQVDSITAEKSARFSQKCKVVPVAAAVTGTVLLCLLYLVFFGAQTASLFSAFSGQGQNGLTLAEFARRGFFELCKVVMINFAVIAVSSVLIRLEGEESRLMRVIHVILSVETLLLIASALSKMVLYITRYGLTPKRVYTSWFMVVLAVIFVLIILSRFRKINLARGVVLTCAVSFLLLCYSNIDGRIVKYNIDRYQSGTLESVDVDILYGAPDAAKPYALKLYRNVKDSNIKNNLGVFLREQSPDKDEFQQMNLQKWTALRLPKE
ncbi:DUF4153 domain-containing protein [Caproiciproducens faecalis]|uniref:DUF4173 domain-containing protein n=1 Tax=Caproiciproducens faecalis TaxID=2820301 RepID=A0ABS7DQ91_9FIRM|nr:DUF4173 domain-containing protein [Caproiciproducens faecalis]MBW7573460.1 DUF4173 domain-containing protein [Caproiciproducens faecalis]